MWIARSMIQTKEFRIFREKLLEMFLWTHSSRFRKFSFTVLFDWVFVNKKEIVIKFWSFAFLLEILLNFGKIWKFVQKQVTFKIQDGSKFSSNHFSNYFKKACKNWNIFSITSKCHLVAWFQWNCRHWLKRYKKCFKESFTARTQSDYVLIFNFLYACKSLGFGLLRTENRLWLWLLFKEMDIWKKWQFYVDFLNFSSTIEVILWVLLVERSKSSKFDEKKINF